MLGLQLLSIITNPLLGGLLLPEIGRRSINIAMTASALFLFQFLPLVIGQVIGMKKAAALVLEKYAGALANVALALVVVLVLFNDAPEVVGLHSFTALTAMAMLLVLSAVVGYFSAGTRRSSRRAGAITTAGRKAGVALLVATQSWPVKSQTKVTIVVFGLVELVALLTLAGIWGELRVTRIQPLGRPRAVEGESP